MGNRVIGNEAKPYLIFVTVLLVAVGIVNTSLLVGEDQVSTLIVFLPLLAVHIALHWQSQKYWEGRRRYVFISVQTMLAFVLSLLLTDPGMSSTFYASLVGVTIGVSGASRAGVFTSIFYLLPAALFLYLTDGIEGLTSFAERTLPSVIFVGLVVALYARQSGQRHKAQQLAAELSAANTKLMQYSEEVEQLTISAERQRMARELHDTVAQGLAGLTLQLEAAQAHMKGGHVDRAEQILTGVMSSARETLHNSRAAIDDLRNHETRAKALPSRIRSLVTDLDNESSLDATLDLAVGIQFDQLSEDTAQHVERIISEALLNIQRHAGASKVSVTVEPVDAEGNLFSVTITDDGRGFVPSTAAGQNQGHYGMTGMRERAGLMDGTISIDSGPGKGTTIVLGVPDPRTQPVEAKSV